MIFCILGLDTACSSTYHRNERSLISDINNFNFDVSDSIQDLSDNDTIFVDNASYTKLEYLAMIKRARQCGLFLKNAASRIKSTFSPGPNAASGPMIRYKLEDREEWISGNYNDLLSEACDLANTKAGFSQNIYPLVFAGLKSQAEDRAKEIVPEKVRSEEAHEAKVQQRKEKLAQYARKYNAIDTTADSDFTLGHAMGDSRYVGKKIIYSATLGPKRDGYIEAYGIPPLLLKATPELNKIPMLDTVIVLARVTDMRAWRNSQGMMVNLFRCQVLKVLK